MTDIVGMRLEAQRLIGLRLSSPDAVVRMFGAVRAPEYRGATWAL
jgi:hypothetical protein